MEHAITQSPPGTAFTVGVEEEYQLVDPASGALRSSATAVRADDWTGELVAELQETTIEIATPVCASAADAASHLQRLRFQANTVAGSQGLAIVAAGLHPFSSWEGHRRPALERYQAIEERYGRIARDEHIFGMHVHVGVPDGQDRIALMNTVRHYLPHLLALSASSPFLEGSDTGFVSFRTIMWRRWPNSGIPPRFESDAEFYRYVQLLLDSGTMADPWNLYWSLRPHPKFPTIEFRVTDVCPSVRDAAAITALARAIVHAAATGALDPAVPGHTSPVLEQELLRINEWRTARDGLSARIIDTRRGEGHESARSALRRLLDAVGRSAEELGDTEALAQVDTILERGSAADRMRRCHEEFGSMKEVVGWLVRESLLGTGLDRRGAQRDTR
ncbi:MAG TPA: YbdK family carboxylate-amine ligase [Longimicrobiales bacterium]|nr:YbdK family carboxylate-amine ligase [Longimicrobiales bacterium]